MNKYDRAIILALTLAIGLLTIPLIYFALGWKNAERRDGATVIRMNPPMRFAGLVMFALGAVFPFFVLVMLVVAPPDHVGHVVGAIVFVLLILLGTFYTGRMTRETYAVITADGVGLHFPFWGDSMLVWADVTKAELFSVGAIKLYGPTKPILFIPTHWAGLDALRDEIVRRVPPERITRPDRWA